MTDPQRGRRRTLPRTAAALALLAATWLWIPSAAPARAVWPAIVALVGVVLLQRVLAGLALGGLAGAILLQGGDLVAAVVALVGEHLLPALSSRGNRCVIAFTLLLGGFAALIERGGGLQTLLGRWLARPGRAARRVQWSAFGMGLLCFFDGLANSMIVGRSLRRLAARAGVSGAKLAYLVDSTSAAVACVAVISTWIAFQLTMIQAGFATAELEVQAYRVFLRSIPLNFYCWFTIALMAVAIWRGWNPGPMARAEARAGEECSAGDEPVAAAGGTPAWRAFAPLALLLGALLVGLYLDGAARPWPITWRGIADALGSADAAVVLVVASILGCLAAYALNPRGASGEPGASVFLGGVAQLIVPVMILLGAWVLSSTLKQLGASAVIAGLLAERMPVGLFPLAVFATGTLVSFTTGTSWGTMGVLMPLALPVALALSGSTDPTGAHPAVAGTVAAVFSGAVFGDHCSPLSDTTIVSSIACGIEPLEHVRTQLPYALIAASVAAVVGFLPAGFGVSPWLLLPAGAALLVALPAILKRRGFTP